MKHVDSSWQPCRHGDYRTLAGRVFESPKAVGHLDEIASFRGSGMKGATDTLLADRVADRLREA